MRMRVVLELDVELSEQDIDLNLGIDKMRDSVAEAISNALHDAKQKGYNHALEDKVDIILSAVHVLKE